MNIRKNIELVVFMGVMAILSSCAEKFDLTQIELNDDDVNVGGDTVFVLLNPVWEGYNKPQDIMVGREPFIYVADTENDRIVMLNLAGEILSSTTIKHPVALAQDYRLNLFVCAQFDTVINGTTQTFSAVYKLDLVAADHQLDAAPIKRILPQLADFTHPAREYTGAAVFFDNTYFISRKGPSNSNLLDPDNSILIFIQNRLDDGTTLDIYAGRVPFLDPTGTGINSANQISSLTSFNALGYDMILTLTGENSFKTQWLEFVTSPEFTGYRIALPPAASDLMTPGFFDIPEGAALDPAENIYVADAAADSVYKFNAFGDLLIAFGGPEIFNGPFSVAFFDKTLYVADTGNNRILRFILSTDL
jgi:hypothetical protein